MEQNCLDQSPGNRMKCLTIHEGNRACVEWQYLSKRNNNNLQLQFVVLLELLLTISLDSSVPPLFWEISGTHPIKELQL